MAWLKFKPTEDWSFEEAKELYEKAPFPEGLKPDTVVYSDAIEGMKKMPPECVDLIIADPPFGLNFSGKEAVYNRTDKLVIDGYAEVNPDNYAEFTDRWISELPRIMKRHASAYIFSGWTNLIDILNALKKHGLTVINHIIWKYQFGVFTRKKFVTSHYHILFAVKDPKKYYFNKIEHYPTDVWEIPRKYMRGVRKNGTKLPEEIVARCINFSSRPGDLVFDPFMGNGTTAVAARTLFRHFYGFEINPNLREIHEEMLRKVRPGDRYEPYINLKPSPEELKRKYPHLTRFIEESSE